jgi:hypothetical protein
MNTYTVLGNKPYTHIIKANNEEEVRVIVLREYSSFIISSIIKANTDSYQSAYDNEQFDSNGRRKF